MPRLGLSLKIFLGSAAVVTALLVATLFVTSTSAKASAELAIERGLAESNARIEDQLSSRQDQLAGKVRIFGENPDAMQLISQDTVGNEARDQARVLIESSGALWVQITDAQGILKARSDEPISEKRDLGKSPLVRTALSGRTARGFGVSGDTAMIELVALPLLRHAGDTNGVVVGVIMAALEVGDSLAKFIGARTGSEIAFYAIDSKGAPRVGGTTRPAAEREALRAEIAARLREGGASGDSTGSSAPARKSGSMMGSTGRRALVDLGGVTYVGQVTPVYSAAGAPAGGILAMRSLDAELAGFYDTRRKLLLTGAIGLVVAFLFAAASTRQIVSPVQALVAATRRAADGDYDAEIPVGGTDEIGTLAEAVRRLLRDLREKQSLVEFLEGGRGRTTATLLGGDEATLLMSGVVPRSDGALNAGSTLGGRYDVKALLGAGGMGMVYRAVDRELQEVVAIKTLRPELIASDTTALERFKSEIRLARKISHRNVVRTHDLGESHGLYFITMEFVEGKSLKDLVRERGRLPVAVLLPIAKQICRALEVAHEAGVIHRDIKPQNMVVERDGTLKVMDFGIARLAARAPTAGLTQAGMVIGTPEYMAPEQLLGDEIDARADVYSAGVVLYECLTGRLPFEAPSPIVLITRVLEETAAAPHTLFSDVPMNLSTLVMRAMSRERDLRPPTAERLHDELEAIG